MYYNGVMRNYQEQPLLRGEKIHRDDLYEIYINQNYSTKETAVYFNTTIERVRISLKYHGIKKDPKKRFEIYKKTMQEKYGVENIFEKAEYIKLCTINKLGVPNSSMLKATVEKRKQTNLERYGTPTPAQSETVKEKMHKTMHERYGGNCPLASEKVKAKMRATNQERYGVDYIGSRQEVKEKRKQTCLEKYGAENYMLSNDFKTKSRQGCLEKYGVDIAMKSETVQAKVKQACLERYGVENVFASKEIQEKVRQSMLDRYGVEHAAQKPDVYHKICETFKTNGTYRQSKAENKVYELLCTKFSEVIRQYQDERYPYNCDFYIPEQDLFIEYQGYQGHGKHPYDPYNHEDVALVNQWLDKSRELNHKGEYKAQYLTYQYVWTVSDVQKRRCAKENNLNWKEFFNMKEFLAWFEQI